MKAILMNVPGGPEVLSAADVPAPIISAPSDVLVKIYAAGINPIGYQGAQAQHVLSGKIACDSGL